MSVFSVTMTTALNYYKAILRKNLAPQPANGKIKQLKLKRCQLQHANDMELYQIVNNVIADIEQQTMSVQQSPSWHFGLSDFLEYLKNTLDEYKLENNEVVHMKQNASRAIVEAIQLTGMAGDLLNDTFAVKLDQCIRTVARYGSPEQHAMLQEMLTKRLENGQKSLFPFLHRLKHYLDQATKNWSTI